MASDSSRTGRKQRRQHAAPDWRAAHATATRPGAFAGAAASLLWLPQAFLIAATVSQLATTPQIFRIALYACAYLALGLLRASLDAWATRRQFAASRACLTSLRGEAVAALACRSPLDRERVPSGQAASVLAEQADALLPWLLRFQPARWRAMVVPPLIALCVLKLSWLAALVLLLSAPAIPLFMIIIGWRAKAASETQLRQLGGMNGFLLDRLRGLGTLRSLGATGTTAVRLRAAAEALRASTMAVLRIAFLSSTALELFAALGVALVAVYVGFHLLGELPMGSWGRRLSLGEGLFILLLAPAFYEPIRDMAALWHDKAAGDAACTAMAQLHEPALAIPTGALTAAPAGALAVELEQLRFQHAGAAALFDGLELRIEAGEHVALVGASGTGKTTVLALIAGLAQPDGGHVRLGGVDLADGADALRTRMAWIGQHPHIFAGTVGSNVSMQRPGVTALAVERAISVAGLDQVHHATPGDSLGEGGAGLSGGELVRMSLARAAAAPDAGLLLADEPSAHLDRASAAAVTDALLALAHGRTLLVATHDLALAARMDRTIDLDALKGLVDAARRAA